VQNASQLNAVFKQISEKPGEPARASIKAAFTFLCGRKPLHFRRDRNFATAKAERALSVRPSCALTRGENSGTDHAISRFAPGRKSPRRVLYFPARPWRRGAAARAPRVHERAFSDTRRMRSPAMNQVLPRRSPQRLPVLPQRPQRIPSPVLPQRPQLSPRAAIPQTFDYRAWLAARNAPAPAPAPSTGSGGSTSAGVNPSAPVINSPPAFTGSGYTANTSLPESVLGSGAPVMRFDPAAGLSGLPTGGLGGGGMTSGAPMMPAPIAAPLSGMAAGAMVPPSMPAPPADAAGAGIGGTLQLPVPFDIAREPPITIGGAFYPDVSRLPLAMPTTPYATAPLAVAQPASAGAPPSLPMPPLGLLPSYLLSLPSESGGSTMDGFAPWMLGGY
jgi:hypothetical protein